MTLVVHKVNMSSKNNVDTKFNFVSRKQKEVKMSYRTKWLATQMGLSQTETMYSRGTKISVSVLD